MKSSVDTETNISFWKKVQIVKILGIYFSLDPKISEEMNYKEILN